MHYVKHFKVNGIDTKQVACIELQGKPNAATEGAVGVLGMDMTSPTHDIYRCVAVNGSVYTWEKFESGSGGVVDDKVSKFDFLSNTQLDYKYDEATGANYTVIRIFRDKLDGTKQFPFVYAPNLLNSGTYSTYDLVNKEHFLLAINAGVFDTSTISPKGLLIQDGMLLQDSAVNNDTNKCKALTIDSDGNLNYVAWNANGSDLVNNGIKSAVCGFMPIIVDFQPVDSSEWNSISHYTENAQRQIIGQFGNGDYAIVTCEGRGVANSDGWTILEAQSICKSIGLKFAYNLDGGGSTETMLCDKHLNTIYESPTGRKVPTFIVFNGTTNLGKKITYYTDIDFLQVSGAQYIDTGIPETEIYSIEYRVLNENFTWSAGHILSSANCYTAFTKGTVENSCMLVKKGSYSFTGYNRKEFNITPTEPYTVKEAYDGTTITVYCNDEVFHSFTPETSALSANNNFFLFAYGGNLANVYMFTGKFYYLKLWDVNGNLVHHYKPVQRWDGVRGLYDVVTQKFFASNSGTQF